MRAPLHRPSENGSALLLVLGLMAIITVTVIAYLAYTSNERLSAAASSYMTLSRLLADGATDLIILDLVSEMNASSTRQDLPNGCVLRPNAAAAMTPVRVLRLNAMTNNPNFANLAKQSVRNKGGFPTTTPYNQNGATPAIIAAQSSTADISRNGRRLSVKRWNAPSLLFNGGFSSDDQLPDWVLLTRAGLAGTGTWDSAFANHSPANSKFVIGRFAFNIYNVGGLIDVNAAGTPSMVTAASLSSLQSSPAGATLTDIPGITTPDTLVTWRNPTTASNSDAYVTYATGDALRQAFLQASSGDRRFFSRSDLIRWVKNNSSALLTDALPYLTHFTRTLDAPSLTRDTRFDSIDSSYPNGTLSDIKKLNPDLLATGFATDTTLPDGTAVKAGTPVAFRRFPLRRLGLVTKDATAAKSNTDPIYRAFGLYRANALSPWVYDHGSLNQVLTLDQVAKANREPDFFELMQAAIARGSLGASCSSSNYNDLSQSRLGLDQNFYRQILQIGANAIDQYDSNNEPTRINFADGSGNLIEIFGTENLPYINGIGEMIYRRATPTDRSTVGAWLQFQVWNPNGNASQSPSGTRLRIMISQGEMDIKLSSHPGITDYSKLQGLGYLVAPSMNGGMRSFTTATSSIEFTNSPTLSMPHLLSPPSTGDINLYPIDAASDAQSIVNESITSPPSIVAAMNGVAVKFAGIYVTELTGAYDDVCDGQPDKKCYANASPGFWNMALLRCNPKGILGGAPVIELQMKVDQNWVTYQKIGPITGFPQIRAGNYGFYSFLVPRFFGTTPLATSPQIAASSLTAVDPKTQRFSTPLISGMYASSNAWRTGMAANAVPGTTSLMIQNGTSGNNGYYQGAGWPNFYNQVCSGMAYNQSDWPGATAGSYQVYFSPDKVMRQGDGNEAPSVSVANRVYPLLPSSIQDRPPILNRPFKTVGELGYVFRDEPWKTLDFFTDNSGDGGLLDVFCLEENLTASSSKPLRAGVISLNSTSKEVITALLDRSEITDGNTSTALSTTTAQSIAQAFISYVNQTPMQSKGELSKFLRDPVFHAKGLYRKTEKEAVVRALGDSGDVRTWNLMIDVVVQSGRYAIDAANLSDFVVQGERRYWVFVAIDRFTGEVIDRKIESVYE